MKFGQLTSIRILRMLSLLLVLLLLLLPGFCVHTGAESSSEGQAVKWVLTGENNRELEGDGVVYKALDLPENCEWFFLSDRYVYAIDIFAAEGELYEITSYTKYGYIVMLSPYYESDDGADAMYYGRTDMLDEIQAYLNGQTGQYVLRFPYDEVSDMSYRDEFADLHESVATELMASAKEGQGTLYDVTVLADCQVKELRYQDETGMLTTLKGMIYTLPDGALGYVHYDHLENHHFDADGHFSYRKGEVEVHILDDDMADIIQGTKEYRYEMDPVFKYESNELDWEYEGIGGGSFLNDTKISFWILFVLVGFLLPMAPLIIGLIFAHAKKRISHPKRWYLIVGFSAAWMLLSDMLLLLLLI